jgi:hypothetical protein
VVPSLLFIQVSIFHSVCCPVFSSAPLLAQGAEKPPLATATVGSQASYPIFGRGNPYQQNRKKKQKNAQENFFRAQIEKKTKI